MMMPVKREMDEERDGPFTGEMFEAEVARNRPYQACLVWTRGLCW